jgi:hypothetical protein
MAPKFSTPWMEVEKLDKLARRTFGLSDHDSNANNVPPPIRITT